MARSGFSVRSKLALMFVSVSLATFGIGGTLAFRSAGDALEAEMGERLRFQTDAYALALDGYLQSLQRRAQDFASDGQLIGRLEELAALPRDSELFEQVSREAGDYLVDHKLHLESAFLDLSVLAEDGSMVVWGVRPPTPEHAASIERAGESGPCVSDLLPTAEQGEFSGMPLLAVSVPIRSRVSGDSLGRLVAWIHPGVWIVEALRQVNTVPGEEEIAIGLSLVDRKGRRLIVEDELIGLAGLAWKSERIRSGEGLELVGSSATSEDAHTGRAGVVWSRALPLFTSDWKLEVETPIDIVSETVAALQSRFIGMGIVIALAACLLFLLPLRVLMRPLFKLTEAARRLEVGDFSTRVEVDSEDEIGELGSSFNSMAQAVEEHARIQEMTAEDLRQRQSELSFERDRLRAVISSMRDGLIVLDPDGEPVLHNHAAGPLLRYLRSSGGGLTPHHVCEEARGTEDACRGCLFDPQRSPKSCQLEFGGGVYEVHATRLKSDEGGRAGRVLVSHDLSSRVSQDERHIHQERLAVLGEVAAVMAHELNNPLAAISMYNQMTATSLNGSAGSSTVSAANGDSELTENVRVIQRNVETCKRTIRELLDYSTGTTPEITFVDVHATLEDVAAFVRPLRERANVQLQIDYGPQSLGTSGDEVQVRQVFVNLLMNAIQALSPRGGKIHVQTAADTTHAVVTISDDGPGIPTEIQEEIFRPFFTTKERGSGTGLGLPTARRIAEMHGGGLELIRSDSTGTVFRVRLMLREEDDA